MTSEEEGDIFGTRVVVEPHSARQAAAVCCSVYSSARHRMIRSYPRALRIKCTSNRSHILVFASSHAK